MDLSLECGRLDTALQLLREDFTLPDLATVVGVVTGQIAGLAPEKVFLAVACRQIALELTLERQSSRQEDMVIAAFNN